MLRSITLPPRCCGRSVSKSQLKKNPQVSGEIGEIFWFSPEGQWDFLLGELRCRFPYAYCAVTSNLCHLPGDVSYSTVTFKSFSTLSFWLGVNRSSEQQITREIKEFKFVQVRHLFNPGCVHPFFRRKSPVNGRD